MGVPGMISSSRSSSSNPCPVSPSSLRWAIYDDLRLATVRVVHQGQVETKPIDAIFGDILQLCEVTLIPGTPHWVNKELLRNCTVVVGKLFPTGRDRTRITLVEAKCDLPGRVFFD